MRSYYNSTDIEDKLLSYLRSELDNPHIAFISAPTPVTGGFDTIIYRFQIKGAPEELSRPLVLRVFARDPNPYRALFESVVQNALASSGYPAPRAFFTCNDVDTFGASFMIMELMPGHPMFEEPENAIPKMLAKSHLHLHSIDTGPVRDAVMSAGIERKYVSFEWRLRWLKERIETEGHEWLFRGLRWVDENRQGQPERLAVIHGDFHPLNILVDDGRVSGVLDWSGFLLADPAYDIAVTRVLGTVAAPSDWLQMVRLYYDHYQDERPVDAEKVEYYEAFRCLWALLEAAEGHSGWSQPEVMRRLSDRFEKITGVMIHLPN